LLDADETAQARLDRAPNWSKGSRPPTVWSCYRPCTGSRPLTLRRLASRIGGRCPILEPAQGGDLARAPYSHRALPFCARTAGSTNGRL